MENKLNKISVTAKLEKIVWVGNIAATTVLRCSNGLESEADLKSVRISELAQKLPELATYFSNEKTG